MRLGKEGVKAIFSVPTMRLCCSQHLGLPEMLILRFLVNTFIEVWVKILKN